MYSDLLGRELLPCQPASVDFCSTSTLHCISHIPSLCRVLSCCIFCGVLFECPPRTTKVCIEHMPAVRKIAEDVLELVFTPRAIARQFVLAIALETGALTAEQLFKALRAVSANFSSRARLIRQLRLEQSVASTQDDWMDLAERIDSIQGNDLWRSEPDCPLYEADRISARIDELVHLMRRRDIFDLMFCMRGGIARNKFGLLHEGLFSKALAGSKMLVETYHNVVCGALDFVCDAPVLEGDEPIPTEAVRTRVLNDPYIMRMRRV